MNIKRAIERVHCCLRDPLTKVFASLAKLRAGPFKLHSVKMHSPKYDRNKRANKKTLKNTPFPRLYYIHNNTIEHKTVGKLQIDTVG